MPPAELACLLYEAARVDGWASSDLLHRAVLRRLGRRRLTTRAAETLTHVLPLARMVGGIGKQIDALVTAYRSGGGVSWAEFGDDLREGQAAANRPLFLGALPREYLPSIPEVAAVLSAGGRIADIGCGGGWSSIGIALAHPGVTVDGYDVDGPSIEAARTNAVEAGVSDRVHFHTDSAAGAEGRYDLVAAFECIHDMPDPVSVLVAMRELAQPDGISW